MSENEAPADGTPTIDLESINVMRHGAHEIRSLRRQLGEASLKAHAFDVLSVALLGKPEHGGMAVDAAWLLDKRAEELTPKSANTDAA